ncbi:MAG: hypothetical protein LBF15_05800 [Candidatus Peribacteria bacterium]|nr:hypothetical protein [Candidatus Peribacteria bacterium]
MINKLCDKNEVFELDKIYISKIALNTISAKFFLHWHFITDNLPKEKNKN